MLITPDMLEHTYILLQATLPFRRWHLPSADDLEFCVTLHSDRFGHFDDKDNRPGRFLNISVSARHVKTLDMLTRTIAHEMVHARLHSLGARAANHGPRFQHLAALVCRRHGWDLATF